MQNLYTFPAIFYVDDDGVAVEFPDLPGCLTCADNVNEAMDMATEAMHLHLYFMEVDGDEIPEPTPLSEIQLGKNEVLAMIHAWMPPFRKVMANKQAERAAE